MADLTTLDIVRGMYDYHWWANRQLFDVVTALGEEAAAREVGRQFSFRTLKGVLAHLYGADWIWLSRWQGTSPKRLPGDGDAPTLAALRARWDDVEKDQRAFVQTLTPAAVARHVSWTSTEGKPFSLPQWVLLQHVVNHATHHRSEIATMVTIVSASPPDTGLHTHAIATSGQGDLSRLLS